MAWIVWQSINQIRVHSLFKYSRMVLLGLIALLFAACSGDSGSNNADNNASPSDDVTQTTVQGEIINGPLDGAEVSVFDEAGELLGTTASDLNGGYTLDVSARPPYRIETEGGLLDGVPYKGNMQALCEIASACSATPYTSVLMMMTEEMGFNYADAKAYLAGLTGINEDPFTNPDISAEIFRLDVAREIIDDGSGLEVWVNSVVAWLQEPSLPAPAGVPAPELEPPVTPPSYTVGTSAGSGGSLSPSSHTVTEDNVASFTVTPDLGYRIAIVSGCGGALNGNVYTTGPVTGACDVTASFSLNSYSVTAVSGDGGSIGPGSVTVTHGATTQFDLMPETGYALTTVTGCDGNLSANTYTTGPVTAACTVTASFSLKSYTVTPSAGDNGSISPDAAQTVGHGDPVELTITPDTGYGIASVGGSCGGNLVNQSYITSAITGDCTVMANFSLKSYTVTPSAGDNGSISPDAVQTAAHGGLVDFTITPDASYIIEAVTGCGGYLANGNYTTGAITADCAVRATFALPAPQDLETSSGDGEVDLTWTAVTGATDYCVYASEIPGIHPDTAASYSLDLSGCIGSNAVNYTATGLSNDPTYYFVITASDGNTESAASDEVIAHPAAPAIATGLLNDTGIDWCADGANITLECPVTGYVGQDGDHGRDAQARKGTLIKVGEGAAGFDFTKLNGNGDEVSAGVSDWSCVRDNHTGLVWEVKTTDGGLHDRLNSYTWYNPDPATNGRNAGVRNGGDCVDSDCDTYAYVQAVNARGLCGAGDWRLPTVDELHSLTLMGTGRPTIEKEFFPNTLMSTFWSASPFVDVDFPDSAWVVSFLYSQDGSASVSDKNRVRLVRGER